MFELPQPILVCILSYLTYYEIRTLARVSKEFLSAGIKVVLVKPPNGSFVKELLAINSEHFKENFSQTSIDDFCRRRFRCDGYEIYSAKKILEEDYWSDGAKIVISLTLTATKTDTEIISLEEKVASLKVVGIFFREPLKEHGHLLKLLKEIHPDLLADFSVMQLTSHILDVLLSRFILSVMEEKKTNNITLAAIREALPVIYKGALSEYALKDGNKQLTAPCMVFNSETTRQIIATKFRDCQVEQDTVPLFLTAILEFMAAEIFELSGNAAKDDRCGTISVDHVLMAIEADEELKATIRVREFEPSLLKDESESERILTGKITKEEDGIVYVETEPFSVLRMKISYFRAMDLYDFHQNQADSVEGVIIVDNLLNKEIHDSLMENVNKFAQSQTPDYHPGSDNMVRDYVHPGLYSYVDGVSQFIPSTELPTNPIENGNVKTGYNDLWGRNYETSHFQWLPTYIDFKDGTWCFRNEINNLPRHGNESLYRDLERLFSSCVPYLEHVVGYARTLGGMDESRQELKFLCNYDDGNNKELTPKTHILPHNLTGKSIQVICKIVDYELQPEQTYEGIWHVEGMSHENIIATADYIAQRDDSITGGELLVKRAYLQGEARSFFRTGQDRIHVVNHLIDKGFTPLGKIPTTAGRLIVFPNSHVHKICEMKNEGSSVARRRIFVFFFINPDVRIISTQEVTPESQMENISHQEALKYRFRLMEERKFHKQDWNVREISLCEH